MAHIDDIYTNLMQGENIVGINHVTGGTANSYLYEKLVHTITLDLENFQWKINAKLYMKIEVLSGSYPFYYTPSIYIYNDYILGEARTVSTCPDYTLVLEYNKTIDCTKTGRINNIALGIAAVTSTTDYRWIYATPDPFSGLSYKINGDYKNSMPWKKINGKWQRVYAYKKTNGSWKKPSNG